MNENATRGRHAPHGAKEGALDDGKGATRATPMPTRERPGLTSRDGARAGLRPRDGLAPAGHRAALSNIGNMMHGAQGARQTRSSKAR
jgi:hypothetical protein